MRIYVASSWRCAHQPAVVEALRNAGHEVYDFRNPHGDTGFSWRHVDGAPTTEKDGKPHWTTDELVNVLMSPVANAGFKSDFDAMKWADACVLVMPCGRSAHLEAGWFVGAGKPLVILQIDPAEPDLMYLMASSIEGSIAGAVAAIAELQQEANA